MFKCPQFTNVLSPFCFLPRWVEFDHHDCHSAMGFYDSPFNSALVAASDGTGNTTSFEVFAATREHGLRSLARVCIQLFKEVINHC